MLGRRQSRQRSKNSVPAIIATLRSWSPRQTKSFDPQHSNVAIHTDGTIAAVYFNVDGKANNRGSETWQLVKAADGWRIASIVYSSEPPVQQ
jgi:hypothetical protein